MKTKIFRNRFVSLGVCRVAVLTGLMSAFALYLAPCMEGQDVSANAKNHRGTIVTFDAPGALNALGAGTVALSINPAGEITGFYLDANYEWHGFLRARDGTFTTFDPPGSVQTAPASINPAGEIAGLYLDPNGIAHAFRRARDGTFTTFDFPVGTFPSSIPPILSINPARAITSSYCETSGCHSFLRSPGGTFTTFDAPLASDTFASSINPAGVIAGYSVVVTFPPFSITFHGFLRARDGTITTFDVPGASDTIGDSINPAGVIAGFYYDASDVAHGYLRARDGAITTFDVPGAGTGPFQGTGLFGVAINPAGTIAGDYVDASNVSHGFLRAADGTISTFDPPGSVFTSPASINPAAEIAGSYTDANGASHGFVRIP
jgi:hypothetical protein